MKIVVARATVPVFLAQAVFRPVITDGSDTSHWSRADLPAREGPADGLLRAGPGLPVRGAAPPPGGRGGPQDPLLPLPGHPAGLYIPYSLEITAHLSDTSRASVSGTKCWFPLRSNL